ncbi:MAG: small multi-drug export protein [Endomicrobiia bacterium]|nr:small multi-drug export protein [Endomicrobiia bacterium]
MRESIAAFFNSFLPPEITTLVIAAMPIVELRGALPTALVVFGFSFPKAYTLSVVGNLLPVAPLLLFLDHISSRLMRFGVFKRFFDWWFARTRRHSALVEKYEVLGLILFVAVPLPMTGAWSGCVAAYLLGIKFVHAVSAIALGVLIAGLIVGSASVGALKFF